MIIDIINWFDGLERGTRRRKREIIDVEFEDLSEPPKEIEQCIITVDPEDVFGIEHKWEEHLTWCPSQIFYNFIDPLNKRPYQLYLRWRHSDPWTANLYVCKDYDYEQWGDEVQEFTKNLGDKEFNRLEFKDLELYCLEILRTIFPHIDFKDPV